MVTRDEGSPSGPIWLVDSAAVGRAVDTAAALASGHSANPTERMASRIAEAARRKGCLIGPSMPALSRRWALCDVRWKFSVYDCFARGVSRVRASCTVPRLQVRPLASHNEDLNSLNSLSAQATQDRRRPPQVTACTARLHLWSRNCLSRSCFFITRARTTRRRSPCCAAYSASCSSAPPRPSRRRSARLPLADTRRPRG